MTQQTRIGPVANPPARTSRSRQKIRGASRLPFEREQENQTFRNERAPYELEEEAIESSDNKTNGWVTRSL